MNINKYPYTDFHELNLDWFLAQFKTLTDAWDSQQADYNQFKEDVTTEFNNLSGQFDTLEETVQSFTSFITNYFDNLDVQEEINIKLNAMVSDGTMAELLAPVVAAQVPGAVSSWMEENVNPVGSAVVVDNSLTIQGAAADAKATGDKINNINENLDDIIRPIPDTRNIYDAEHNSVDDGTMFKIGTVYLYDYVGDLVISTQFNRAAYFTELHVYNANNIDMGVSYGDNISNTSGATRQGKLVSIPEGAKYLTFRYRYLAGDDSPLITNVMVTKGNTIGNGDYVAYSSHPVISDIIAKDNKLNAVYVSPSGNDNNDGLSIDTAFKTFTHALSMANVIIAKRGIYNESINISDRSNIKIYPYDDDTYAANVDRQKIELNGGHDVNKSDMTYNNGLYTMAYSGGLQFQQVFIDQTLEPVISGTNYRANIFVHGPVMKRYKLKPVLSINDCQNTADSFYWDGITLYCNIADATFTSITILENSYTISISNCVNVHIEDVAIKYAYTTLFRISNSAHVDLINCDAFYGAIAMGIQYNNSDGNMSGCTAIGNGYDGFNFHDYGYTEMINCKSLYNFDDGCSHHEGCNGLIIGGEFVGNIKGGITPAYGAHVNIFNILARDNDHYGIGYLSSSNHGTMRGMMNGCTLVNNPVGLAVGALASVIAINTIFSDNTIDKQISGTLEEY